MKKALKGKNIPLENENEKEKEQEKQINKLKKEIIRLKAELGANQIKNSKLPQV